MTDKTLAEQIRAMDNPEPGSLYSKGYSEALEDAAALADAAATTTPVVGAGQAGDVRQAVMVKPLVWVARDDIEGLHNAQGQTGWWYNIQELPDGQFEYEGDIALGCKAIPQVFATLDLAKAAAQADYAARITAALEPDPTPALSWKAMQTAALKAIDPGYGDFHAGDYNAVAALPGPTDAQLLAEALRLPEVKAMVEYARDASSALAYIQLLHGRMSGVGWERLAGLQLACSPIEAALAKIGEAK